MNLGLNFVMIPTWGAAGAAVATVIAYALQAVAGVVAERSLAPVPQYLGRLVFLSAGVLISSVLTYGILRS
jgi:Na+-driven multidrug efflux pump